MADYKQMYFSLFNKITDIIDELQEIQQMTEEMYIDDDSAELSVVSTTDALETQNCARHSNPNSFLLLKKSHTNTLVPQEEHKTNF